VTQETKLCTVICPTCRLLTEVRSARSIQLRSGERLVACLKCSVHILFLLWIHYETESSSINHSFSFNYLICADAKRPTVRTEVEYSPGQAHTLFRRPFFIGSCTDSAVAADKVVQKLDTLGGKTSEYVPSLKQLYVVYNQE
jgi:hypothetical protein